MLADRAEPTQGTNQRPTQLQTQTEESIGGPDRAHSRYQPTTLQLQTQTEEPIGRPNGPAAQTQRQPLLWPKL